MPKVVLQVQRKAMTRSRTQDEKRAAPPAEPPASPSRSRSRGAAPKPGPASAEPKSTITRVLKATVKVADRKYFTVAEDNAILHFYLQQKDKQTSRAIAEALAKKVKHSVESIRDRIKRFLSRIQPSDQTLIHEEAKVPATHAGQPRLLRPLRQREQ
jgi:gas vesicle protein